MISLPSWAVYGTSHGHTWRCSTQDFRRIEGPKRKELQHTLLHLSLPSASFSCSNCCLLQLLHVSRVALKSPSGLIESFIAEIPLKTRFGGLPPQIASYLHSEKFKMNRNGNSILSENICDLLPRNGKPLAAVIEWNLHSQIKYQYWECSKYR